MSPAKPGDVIDGKYVIEALMGEGGMGAVYAARHRQLDQLVAIKFLTVQGSGAVAGERFLREARAAARVRGEYVCRVLDIGEIDGGIPYMVMEHLVGRDLAQELAERGRLPCTEAVAYLLDACEGLAEAHGAGIVHRDLKPGNLFVVARPDDTRFVKVLDFGVSKIMGCDPGSGLALTATSTLVGSPLYMSPEQLESSRDVDGRTDIWALGVVLYELIMGRPPFVADTVPQLVNAVLHGDIASFESEGVVAPSGLEAVVLRALSRDRDARFESVQALAAALAPYAGERIRRSSLQSPRSSAADALGADGALGRRDLGQGAPSGQPAAPAGMPVTLRDARGGGSSDRAGPSVASNTGTTTPANWERPSGAEPGGKRLWALAAVVAVLGVVAFLSLRGGRSEAPSVGTEGAAATSTSPGPGAAAVSPVAAPEPGAAATSPVAGPEPSAGSAAGAARPGRVTSVVPLEQPSPEVSTAARAEDPSPQANGDDAPLPAGAVPTAEQAQAPVAPAPGAAGTPPARARETAKQAEGSHAREPADGRARPHKPRPARRPRPSAPEPEAELPAGSETPAGAIPAYGGRR